MYPSDSDPSSYTSAGQDEEPGVPQYEPDPSKIEFEVKKVGELFLSDL